MVVDWFSFIFSSIFASIIWNLFSSERNALYDRLYKLNPTQHLSKWVPLQPPLGPADLGIQNNSYSYHRLGGEGGYLRFSWHHYFHELYFFLHPCSGKTQCWIELEPWQWKVYMTLVAITVFLIPAIIITACYTIIVYTIWTKSKVLSPVKQSDSSKRE